MLLNRNELIATLFRETERAQRMMTSLAVILCGINGWENSLSQSEVTVSNDLTTEIVARIARHLRCYDSLGSYGDGEFALVLPGCNGFNAMAMAQRLRAEAFSPGIKAGREEFSSTACFGVAGSGGRSPLVVLRNAEQALKTARVHGPGAIERCAYDTEPDSATFLFPVIFSDVVHR